jgi:phosphoribosylaminoimidazolecarboxamide formyltransferase / IMP cyclohydrolase
MAQKTEQAPIALLSAYNKDVALRDFAEDLVGEGWKLLASSGTKKFLDQHGIPSDDVADMVGEPMLGHRVVTLDRKIYAALLARLDNKEDLVELRRIGVEPISLVYVDLYPLAAELENPKRTFDSIIEKTDIGGPTLLRAAAKGRRFVVSSPEQFQRVLAVMQSEDPNPIRRAKFMTAFLSGLAAEAETKVAEYAALSAKFHQTVADGNFSSTLPTPA